MPKLRNAETDLGQFTQWLARKCRNHNPLIELFSKNRAGLPRMYKDKSGIRPVLGIVGQDAEDRNTIFYQVHDRVFEISVTEVEAMPEKEKMKVVGF